MRKNAFVIGDGILSIVTIITIMLIMGAFVYIASAIAVLKSAEIEKSELLNYEMEGLVLKSVFINANEKREMLVYDAFILLIRGRINEGDLRESLEGIQKKTGNCYFFSYQTYFFTQVWGPGGAPQTDLKVFKSSNLNMLEITPKELRVKIEGKDYLIKQYFGGCK